MSTSAFDPDAQGELWIATDRIAQAPGHPFCRKSNLLLRDEGFDRSLEELCASYCKEGGRPSIPTDVCLRMPPIGYFEGLDSRRGIAWRCQDSLSLREFLGGEPNERTLGQSSLTRIRKRLPLDARERMFALALAIGQRRGLLRGGEEKAQHCHPRILAYNRGVILRLLFGIAKTKTLPNAFERVFQTILTTVFFCKALCSRRLAGIYRRTTDGIHAQCRTNHTRPNLHFFKIALFQRTVWR